MGTGSQRVIAYVADTSAYERAMKRIEAINKSTAQKISSTFNKEISKIRNPLEKTTKKIQVKGFEELAGLSSTVTTNVTEASGAMGVFTDKINVNQKGLLTYSQSYKDLGKNINDVSKNTSSLMGKSSQLGTNLNNVVGINQSFSKQLKGVGFATQVVSRDLKTVSGNVTKMGVVIKTADGRFLHLKETITKTPDGIQKVDKSVKDVTKTFNKSKKSTNALAKSTASLGQNIARLASRAALTIPLWLALRGAIMGVISVVKNGFRDVAQFDKSLQKLHKNLQGTPQQIERNFKTVRGEITKLSLESGRSTQEITSAIQRFATVGFDFETAMQAGLDATRLAVILFGEGEETANGFARALNVLVDKTSKTTSVADQISESMALTSELYEVNAFEISELTSGMQKFAGTAKALNLTTQQTITLMAALSSQGLNPKRANLMRSSFLKMAGSLEKVSDTLGVDVNPKMDTTFDVFRKVIGALAKLKSTSGKISPELVESVREIFQLRGGEMALDFVAGFEEVNAQLDKYIAKKPSIEKFHKDFDKINDTIFQQYAIMGNLRDEIGKAFVIGLTGAGDFKDSLKEINTFLKANINNARELGKLFNVIFVKPKGVSGSIAGIFGPIGDMVVKSIQLDNAEKKAIRDNVKRDIQDALNGSLTDTQLKDLIVSLDSKSLKHVKIKSDTINNLKIQLEKQLSDGFKGTALEAKAQIDVQIKEQDAISEKNRGSKADAILQSELARLKALGATNVELLKAENIYRNMLSIELKGEEALRNKLSLERAIAEEKRLQSKLGSDSLKLYKISEEHGLNVAKTIGDVLSGERDFSIFERQGGKALEVFKKNFASIFEQQKAEKFFTEGRGAGINIQEEALRQPIDKRAVSRLASSEVAWKSEVVTHQTTAIQDNTIQLKVLSEMYRMGMKLQGPDAQRLVNASSGAPALFPQPEQTTNVTVKNEFNVKTNDPEELVNGMIVAMDSAKVTKKINEKIARF